MTNVAAGSRLGPFEILSRIGAGGVGEVFRARDTRLDRSVAIKVLPSEFASNTQLKLRFEREAKSISQLNHPHICTLYDVGSHAGVEYLVMELIEGETLADRITRGALALADVLKLGAQIAEALHAAHRAGIVHRDLKPGNIMITKAGAKLLDFGLAKPGGAVLSSPDAPTEQQKPLTAEGTLLGTFQYMAPEQLDGLEADARTDIFALGAVLYEMATGNRAFQGKTRSSLIAAIVKEQPPQISEVQPLTPPTLEHVIARCLEKDPDDRWQSAHDVAQELRWIVNSQSAAATVVAASRRVPRWLWAAGGLLLLIASAAAWYRSQAVVQPGRQRFDLQPPDGVEIEESRAQSVLAISPDGEWVVFRGISEDQGKSGLYARSTRELDARRVTAPGGAGHTPFFSPDSAWLGFHAEGALQKIRLQGGDPEPICQLERTRGASWGDDGTILFSDAEALFRVSADGGQPEKITAPAEGERHYWPHLLPGSEAALLTVHRGGGDAFRKIAVLTLGDRQIRELIPGTSPQFVDGRVIYSHLGNVYAVDFDPERLRIVGKPKLVLRDVYYYWGSGFAGFNVSRSGELVYVPGTPGASDSELVWLDRTGAETPAVPHKRPYLRIAVSPDATRIAARIATGVEESDLWLYELPAARWTRLTYGKRVDSPMWSPDGEWIFFSAGESGNPDIWRVRADGGTPPEELVSTLHWEYPGSVTPDGRTLVFMRQQAAAQWDLLTLSLDDKPVEAAFLATDVLEAWPTLSPDGRWVAYESDETGARQVHVRPFPGPGPRVTVSAAGGTLPFWSSDGRELFFRRVKEIWSVPVAINGAFTAGAPKRLTPGDSLYADWNPSATAIGGERLLAIRPAPEAQRQRRIVYVPDWLAEVEQIEKREK